MATHRGEALKMIPVMVDDEPFLRAYRNVKINFQPLLASEAVAISDGQTLCQKLQVLVVINLPKPLVAGHSNLGLCG